MNAQEVASVPDELAIPVNATILPDLHRFVFTADFTGQLKSLDMFRFDPMVPVIKGERYELAMNMETGATTVTQLPPDPFAEVKAESARLYKEALKKQRHA